MAADTQRVDKWLWHGRFFKSRSKAAGLCNDGKLRLNGERVGKARVLVRLDDVLTFPQGPHIRVVRIIAISTRRGPAPEAQALYEDLSPPMDKKRKNSPLIKVKDAILIRTDKLSKKEVLFKMSKYVDRLN